MLLKLPSGVGVVHASRIYRASVLDALRGGGWARDLDRAARDAVRRLGRARRAALAPHAGKAMAATARTVFFTAVPLLAAERLWRAGWQWSTVPLLVVAGIALFGAVALVHDMTHGSFVPSRRLNDAAGYLIAPLLLMEFAGFRRSHLGHHRHSQSVVDPKRFGVTHQEDTSAPDHCTLDHSPRLLRPLVRLGAKVVHLPLPVRQVLYLGVLPVFMGPAVLLFSGEFSIANRNWRRLESWLATGGSIAWLAVLYFWSPPLLGLFVAALLIGHSFTFFVFATHLTPSQVYWTRPHRTVAADALNVSDIHCGALFRWLGHGLSDYHSIHHLSPSIPCYHLDAAEAMVGRELTPLRAPAVNLLTPAGCALLYDAFFRGIVRSNAESWDYTDLGGLRRTATPEADR